MQWFLTALSKYAVFSGRARRSEYWYFVLFYVLILLVLSFLDGLLGLYSEQMGAGPLSGIAALALLLPSLAVGARRLHDIGRSAWWLLLALTGIGTIVLLIMALLDSQPGSNEYGPNPKGVEAHA